MSKIIIAVTLRGLMVLALVARQEAPKRRAICGNKSLLACTASALGVQSA
jgi:hypothetical protein